VSQRQAVVVAAVRSPVGRHGGALAAVRPDDLAAAVITALLRKASGLDPAEIAEVILGCANQAGEDNRNIARMAALLAGLPQCVPGYTVNRLCASGLEAVNCAARGILAGEGDVYVAGGVESMSRAPWVLPKAARAFPFGNLTAFDTALGWRFPNPRMEKLFPLQSMGETAENLARNYGIPRADQDAFSLESHARACRARRTVFPEEIVAISVPGPKNAAALVVQDETMREETSLEKLAALRPAFRKDGSVTAGNSSTMNDGAAALLLMEAGKAAALGLRPLARWAGSAAVGLDPALMGLGPVGAVRKLLARTGRKAAEVDLFEINEAFAVQTLACARDLELSADRLNVNGGAIALGHPLGSSGARIVVTLLHEMRRRGARLGVAALCVGVGQGLAALWEGC